MDKIVKDYNSWLKDNMSFIIQLDKHDSSLYMRIQPIYEVLNFLSNENQENGIDFSEDTNKIFQVGLEYLNTQVDTCKLYLEKLFNNDFHQFLTYDRVIGYILYLEDLRYEIEEHRIQLNKKTIDDLNDYLEKIMELKKEVPDNLNLYVDSEIHKIVELDKLNFRSIIDIFVEIADTLGINLYSETEYVIGKEI